MVGSYTIKHILTTWSANHSPWYLNEWKTSIYTNTYTSFIHNCQNLEATKIYFGRWMDKLYIQTMKYYSALKRNELSVSGGNLYIIRWKKSIIQYTKHYIPYDSNSKTFWNGQNYEDSKKINDYQVFRGKKMNRQSIEDF